MSGTPGTMNKAQAKSGCHGVEDSKKEMPDRGGNQGEEPCQQRGYKSCQADVEISIGALGIEEHTQTQAQYGCNGGIEECRPVATELDAEAAARQSSSNGYLPRGVIALALVYLCKLSLVFLQSQVLTNRVPGEMANLSDGIQIDAMLVYSLELGV